MSWRSYLWCRGRIFRNGLLRSRGGESRGLVLWWGLALLVGAMVHLGLLGLFEMSLASGLGPAVVRELLALLLDLAFLGLWVFDLHFALSALFFDSDLDLLRAAPIPAGRLLLCKVLDSAPHTLTLLVAVALPACTAYLSVMDAPRWTWLLLPSVLFALWGMAMGPGVIGALWLGRRVPPASVRGVLAVVGALLLLSIWLLGGLAVPHVAWSEGDLTDTLRALSRLSGTAWASPAHWAAWALHSAATRRPGVALAWGLGLLTATFLLLWLAGRYAAVGLRDAQSAAMVRPARRVIPHGGRLPPPLRSPLIAVIVKDLRQISRQWSVLIDVVASALLWAALPLFAAPLYPASADLILTGALVVLSAGLGYEISARSIPLERSSVALLASSPVPARTWLFAKLCTSAALSGALYLTAAATLGFGLHVPAGPALAAAAWGGLALFVSLCAGLALGAHFADFAWTNPRAMLHTSGRVAAALVLLMQMALWLGLWWALRDAPLPRWSAAGGLVALLCVSLTGLAVNRMRRFEWMG